MADLDERGASSSTKLVGADSSGNETNYVEVTTEGELKISSFANVDFQDAVKNITTTETKASVGVNNLPNRKSLVIFNKGNRSVYYGTTGVTSITGIEISVGELIELQIGDNINVYLVTNNSNTDVIIQEFS